MAWDFSTEPEFEEKLEWMRGFVREEVYPLETLDLTYDQVRVLIRPLQEQVKAEGLWAAHLPPALGGMGFGQVKLGLMHEILGQSPYAPVVFGNNAPDSGNAELLAVGIEASGDSAQRERWLQPLLNGELRSAFSMTEPDTAGSDPTLLKTSAVRDGEEWVINGHKWFTSNGSVADFLIVMAVTNPDVHPYSGSSMIIVPVDTPGVDIVRDVSTMEDPHTPYGRFGNHAEIKYVDVRVPVGNLIGLEGSGFVLAQHRLGPGRIHHCMRWLGQSRRAFDMLCERAVSRVRARVDAGGEADHPELGGGLDGRDGRGSSDDAAGRLEDGSGGGGGGPGRDRHDQVLRGEGPVRRDRPRHPGARVVGVFVATCRSSRCTGMPGRPAFTTDPTRCTARRWRGAC